MSAPKLSGAEIIELRDALAVITAKLTRLEAALNAALTSGAKRPRAPTPAPPRRKPRAPARHARPLADEEATLPHFTWPASRTL